MCRARLAHRFKRFGTNKRCVAVKHQRIALKPVQCGARLGDRMGRAQLFVLQNGLRVGIIGKGCAAHRLGPMSRHNHGFFGGQCCPCAHRVHQHRRAADRV